MLMAGTGKGCGKANLSLRSIAVMREGARLEEEWMELCQKREEAWQAFCLELAVRYECQKQNNKFRSGRSPVFPWPGCGS